MASEKKTSVEGKRRCFDRTSHLCSYSKEAEHALVGDFAAGANCSGFDQAHSANASELKLLEESLPYLSSSSDADIEMYNKKRMRICCVDVDESKKEAGVLGKACDDTHVNCRVCDDCRQSRLGQDSQLEYLSAHEQDFDDSNNSSEFSEQGLTVGIETLELIDPVHEVGRAAKEQILIGLSEDCSASEYGAGDQACPEAAVLELPHLLQDSLSVADCSDVTCDHQEEQTEYHSVGCGSILESHSWGSTERACPNVLVCDSIENGEVRDTPLIVHMLPPQIAKSEEVSANYIRHVHSVSGKQDNPLLLPGEKAPAVTTQFCDCAGDSDFYSCEESGVGTCGASCTTKDDEAKFPVSEILTSNNPSFGVEVAEKSSHGNASCLNSEHRETLKSVANDSMVHQAVDASSDFRACFTTSRSTSAQVCVSARAVNTEITMMNKARPGRWHCKTCADIACSTGWSSAPSRAEEIRSQLTDTLEIHSDGNAATAERSSQIQEQWESKNEQCD
ncbi:PREDICTED: RNA-binding protein 44-like, partial [Mesitornis unicolor]|uniref:RNA-binding protein 44-like n=1 Tax=Mesitornis unicolor TaxID=54374 RepID=UPI000528E0B3